MTTPAAARWNWYWTCQLAGWGGVALFNMAFAGGSGYFWHFFAIALWGAASGVLLSQLWRALLRRRGWLAAKPAWSRIVPCLFLLGLLQSVIVALAYRLLVPQLSASGYGWVPGVTLFWGGVFASWTVFYAAVLALRRARNLEAQALRLELRRKDAELRALQAQVNPHFFFNSLNSVRALIYEDHHAAANMIDQLASLMRYALQSSDRATVPLADELDAVRAYLAIETIRFEQRLRSRIEIEAGLETLAIVPMALQTLVENAVKHGVEKNPDGADIRITARRRDGGASIEVANSGALQTASGSTRSGSTRVGLANARQRLVLSLGPGAGLQLHEHDGWVLATLTLPEHC